MFKIFKEKLHAQLAEKRRQHAQEIATFIAAIKQEIELPADIDEANFYSALGTLAAKWLGGTAPIDDCDGKRLANNMMARETRNLLFIAIVAKRLDCFIKVFERQDIRESMPWLEFACICGAKDIVNYMMGKIPSAIWAKSGNIIPYSLASGDEEFAIQMARIIKPFGGNYGFLHIYSFGQFDVVEKIQTLFGESSVKPQSLDGGK